MDFDVPVYHEVKIKESKKINKYLNLDKQQEKLWNMRKTVIPILFGALGTIPKGREKKTGGIENQKKNRDDPNYS